MKVKLNSKIHTSIILTSVLLILNSQKTIDIYFDFKVVMIHDNKEIIFAGNSYYFYAHSMLSIHLDSEVGNCGIHFLNIKDYLKPGVYYTDTKNDIRVAVTCGLSETEQPERIISESGVVTILNITSDQTLVGQIDLILIGATTRNRFKFIGEFASPIAR